jgi:hypothetical protein
MKKISVAPLRASITVDGNSEKGTGSESRNEQLRGIGSLSNSEVFDYY